MTPKTNRGTTQTKKSLAQLADRYDLYQRAVQCPEAEIEFVTDQFVSLRNRQPLSLREDFCGTAYTACTWVQESNTHRAVGVDQDEEVLAWALQNNIAILSKNQQRRIQLMQANVLEAKTPVVDVALAMNFSYWVLRTRKEMIKYFKRVHQTLVPDGLFFLDCYGGYEAPKVIRERHRVDGFTYIWHQADFDPISSEMMCYIHFRFPDKSQMKKAFSYQWRLWTLPEIREMLSVAGFERVAIYWEQTDEQTGEGNGEYQVAHRGEADPSWVTYLLAIK